MTTEDILLNLKGSICVVGNGPTNNKNGKQIDKFNNIIRFNGYKITGYEDYIGTKTTLWCTHGHSKDITNEYNFNSAISPWMINSPESSNPIDLNINYTKQNISKLMNIKRPTTGGALLYLFEILGICVTAFNFDFFKTERHYYCQRKLNVKTGVHRNSLVKERTLLLNTKRVNFI
jgi:Glycosyltransferase family 29 (sialyltransferase)